MWQLLRGHLQRGRLSVMNTVLKLFYSFSKEDSFYSLTISCMVFSPQSCSPFNSFQIFPNLLPFTTSHFSSVSHLPLLFFLPFSLWLFLCLPISVLVSVSQCSNVLPTPFQIKKKIYSCFHFLSPPCCGPLHNSTYVLKFCLA